MQFYSQAIAVRPRDPVLLCNRSAAFLKLGRIADALDDAAEAVSSDPSNAKAYFRCTSYYVRPSIDPLTDGARNVPLLLTPHLPQCVHILVSGICHQPGQGCHHSASFLHTGLGLQPWPLASGAMP